MKSVILILFIAVSGAVYAQQTVLQKYSPQFTVGTKIDYALDYNGQPVQYNLTIKSMADPIILEWNVPSYGTGTYQLTQKGLKSGNSINFDQVQPGSITQLKDNESVIVISKDAFAGLQKNGSFSVMGLVFTVKPEVKPLSILIKGKPLDLIHVVSGDGAVQVWILNNADFPLLAQIQGNPLNINYTLQNIEN